MKPSPVYVSLLAQYAAYVWTVLDFGTTIKKGFHIYPLRLSPIYCRNLYEDHSNDQPTFLDLLPDNWSYCFDDWNNDDILQFALENGIAPFQPFLVRFNPVVWHKSYDDWSGGYEYDAEYDFEVVRVESWRRSRVAAAWRMYLGESKQSSRGS